MKPRRTMGAWVAVTVALRVAWLARVPPVVTWDGILYARTALRIAHGLGYVDTWNNLPPWKPTAFYPVGYPALLGLGHALFGDARPIAGALNVLAAAVTVASIVALARRAWGPGHEHLPAALYALSPGAVMYASTFMTETVSGALLALALVTAARYADRPAARHALATGALLGAATLVRPQAMLFAPVVALLAAPTSDWRPRLRALTLVTLASCAVVLPWTARNCARLDGCALVSTNGGSNLWIGAAPDADGTYRGLPASPCDRVLGQTRRDRCYRTLSVARIRTDPAGWLALVPAKVQALLDYETAPAEYLRAAGVFDAARAHRAGRVATAWHRAILALAMLGLLTRGARPRVARMCVAVVLGSVAVHGVFFGGDRYHFIVTPMLAVLAGVVTLPPRKAADHG